MISTAILNIIYIFVLGIVSLLRSFGTVSTNNNVTQSILEFKTYYVSLNSILPMGTILSIVAFVLVFEGFYLLYQLIKWGYQKIPGIN